MTITLIDPANERDLANFDYVVTLQAVHELRHKRHAPALFEQIRQVLNPQGSLLVCDHCAGNHSIGGQGMQNKALYMRVEEQYTALQHAGFSQIRPLLIRQGMVLHQAR
jgi:predicted methyltransferase